MSYYGCIYKIKNKINGKVYIGQTIKVNAWDRVKVHFNISTIDSYIGRAINKYGECNFEWEVLACCNSLSDLNYLEIYFIHLNKCTAPNGYNLSSGGKSNGKLHDQTKLKIRLKRKFKNTGKQGNFGKVKESTRIKMSNLRKGFDSKNRKRARQRNVYKRKMNGEFIEVTAIEIKTGKEYNFKSIADCCRELNLDRTCVSRVCRGKDGRTQHKGFRFKTIKYGDSIKKLEENQ